MAQEIRIKNNKKSELILGAVQVLKMVHVCDANGAPLYHEHPVTGEKKPVIKEAQDYVRAAEVIRPGQMSEPMSREQLKVFETPVMEFMRDAGEIEIIVDGKLTRPKAAKEPAPGRKLTETVPDEVAEAAELADLLGGSQPTPKDE